MTDSEFNTKVQAEIVGMMKVSEKIQAETALIVKETKLYGLKTLIPLISATTVAVSGVAIALYKTFGG